MDQSNLREVSLAIWESLYTNHIQYLVGSFDQPHPKNAGYILILVTGSGISITGALLPTHLSWWWLDTVGHLVGGFTLALGLFILFNRTQTVISVIALSIMWEMFEWAIGYPFHVTPLDTKLDLLAGWTGLAIALLGTMLPPFRTQSNS